jgi:hypothetical protein
VSRNPGITFANTDKPESPSFENAAQIRAG